MTAGEHWLHALAVTAPFRQASAFEAGVTQLARKVSVAERVAPAEAELREFAPGTSLEALAQLCTSTWFQEGEQTVDLDDLLVRAAGIVLEDRGGIGHVRDRFIEHPGESTGRWRSYSLLLPPDLWVAAACVDSEVLRLGTARVDGPALTELIHRGVANTHLHLKAAASFDLVWLGAMLALRGVRFAEALRKSVAAADLPFGSATRYELRLLQAALARWVMWSFLEQRRRQALNLSDFLQQSDRRFSHSHPFLGARVVQDALGHLVRATWPPDVSMEIARLRRVLQLATPVSNGKARSLRDLIVQDCIGASAGLAVLPESRLLHGSLRYLRNNHHTDFARLFWQYVRVRSQTYSYLVHRPGPAGLDWFARFYDRAAPFTDDTPLAAHLVEAALRMEDLGEDLRSLEVRRAPKKSLAANRKILVEHAGLSKMSSHAPCPELGTVLHFIRSRARRDHRSNDNVQLADPRHDPFGVRYGTWVDQRLLESAALEFWFRREPEALLTVRGIDAASAELAVPNWCLRPMFVQLRASSDAVASRLGIKGLGLTCHVGEDFSTPLQGLRRIHEVLTHLGFREGDRIGHGLALCVDVGDWCNRSRVCLQSREERLFDLLWELERYAHGDIEASASRVKQIECEAQELSQAVFGEGVTLQNVSSLGAWLYAPGLLKAGYPRRLDRSGRLSHLAVDYLTDGRVYERASWPVEVRLDLAEVEAARACQTWLKGRLRSHEIAIEMNPSSNMLVGALGKVGDHPAFQAAPVSLGEGQKRLLVSINDDDPLTFATSLREEYGQMYGGLRRQGLSIDAAIEWLDRARLVGMRSRFTLPDAADRLRRHVIRSLASSD